MKKNPHPSKLLALAILFVSAFYPGLRAQDTNEITAAIAEQQSHLAEPDLGAMKLFVNAADAAARQAAAERARQTALAARQSVREEIEILSEGAIARFGPHHVTFPAAMPAPIVLRTPDGVLLKGAVLGLAYVSDTGKSVLLAELKRSEGELLDGKTVIFRDVFDGGVSGDLVFEYTRQSFEQLVVIRRQLPTPEELGFSADENVRLAVLTEWFNPPQPRKVARIVSLRDAYQALGIQREENLVDETLSWGAMRMIEGKSFALGEPDLGVPTGKTWELLRSEQGEPRQFLIEATPYRLLKPLLDALPVRTASLSPREPQSLHAALQRLKVPTEPGSRSGLMAKAQTAIDAEPGVVLDYLIVNTPLLSVEFVNAGKFGPAAAGYDPYDYWNPYSFEGYSTGWLANLYWSDWSQSAVGLVVSNAPGVGLNPFCLDPMYQYFIYPTNGGQITVTITNLPTDVYDLFVYATRASDAGAPVVELLRNGTSLWKKATTYWGPNWFANPWDEHEQYARFRNIAVTNQTLTLISYADAAGYASLSGLQIVPSDALPSEAPEIVKLLNINFPGNTPDKVGYAAVGQTTNDFWNERPNATSGATTSLKLADSTTTGAGVIVRNASGNWGFVTVPDLMYQNYIYGSSGGNTTIVLTNLPSGSCDIYIYGHTTNIADNGIFELWSDQVNWGTKGTSIHGPGPTTTNWQVGQQFVLFKGVAVSSNAPLVIHAKHSTYGYQNVNGLQIAYTGDYDSDADGLPDGWEMKWLDSLGYSATDDLDSDGLSNLREYQLALDPMRYDSDADGIVDWQDNEFPWLEDASPQGCYQYTSGGDNWNWVGSWSDGVGWSGGTVYPHSGQKMRVSANSTNTIHQHYFERAVSVIRPGTGDVLYAYVNLDPTKPPSEVMLQFQTLGNNGAYGREYRAYWGDIAYGTDGTLSRTNMGALPTAGLWVRLEVPASTLGLEGRIIEGINFTLYSGRAAWDSAGIVVPDMDGDGVADIDADGLPDCWELEHFGDLNQPGDGDYDNDGVSNLQEFLNGTDPNTIQFSTLYDNLYVSNRTVNGACEMLGGVPSFIAVLVNDTNLNGVSWQAYNSNFNATLPDADGVHTVLLALRGLTTNFPPAWDETEFTLDRVPPVLQITNPTTATVIKPYLQLQGLANEPLLSLVYDLTNAAGLLTNEPAFVVDQYFDTNQFDFTTNYFQAYDVELTNGLNTITLTVSDLAGNVAITNLSLTLDYTTATNPPVLQLLWPTNGAHLSGDSFYVRGWINDETASVKAQIVDGGFTNEFAGLVERNGTFWVEGLPLASGTNLVTLVTEDAAGNLSGTNLTVVKGSVTVTITSTPEGESLYEPFGTVAGTVSDPDYSVSVNGVAATVDESGNWTAENVPVFGRGTAVFVAVAAPTGGGSAPVSVSVGAEMPARIVVATHQSSKTRSDSGPGDSFTNFKRTKGYKASLDPGASGDWTHNYLGTARDRNDHNNGWDQTDYQWTATNRSTHATDSIPSEWWSTNILNDTYQEITGVPDKDTRGMGWVGGPGGSGEYRPIFVHHYYARGVRYEWANLDGSKTKATVSARTKMTLYTGGKAGIKRKSLIHINANAEKYGRPPDGPWLDTPTTNVGATKIEVLGWCLFGRHLDPSGDLYIALPDNEVKDLRLRVPGVKHYGAWATANRHKFVHETIHPALTDTNRARTKLGVGEEVDCKFVDGDFPTNAVWSASAGGLDTTVGNSVKYTAPSNAANATVTATVAGTAKFKIKFNVKEPAGIDVAHTEITTTYTNVYAPGVVAAAMHLTVYVRPTDVSFYRVQCMEVGRDATSVSGYFTNFSVNDLSHKGSTGSGKGDVPIPINPDNSWDHDWDECKTSALPPPPGGWYPGHFTWEIPGQWWILGTGQTNEIADGWQQDFWVDGLGTVTIKKFENKTVVRTINNVVTPAL